MLVSARLSQQLGLGVGERLHLETFTPAAIDRIFAGEPATYDGPRVSLEIVGVGRQPEELTGGADYPAPLFVVAPSFFAEWAGKVHWFDGIFLVQLTDGPDGIDAFHADLRAALPGRDDINLHPSVATSGPTTRSWWARPPSSSSAARSGDEIPLPGDPGPRSLRIVGQALFPSNENEDPAAGAAVTLATLEHLPGTGGFPTLYVAAHPEASSADLASDLETALGFATGPVAPPVISNLELIDESPYLLAGYLGLLGAAVSAHAVLMTIRQRRGELAALKSLGFGRHQVGGTVLAQSLTVAAIGTAAGIPLGLAGSRLAWRLVAGNLGFAVDPNSPLAPLLAVTPATLLLVALIAAPPAWWIARAQPATALRSE